MISCARERESFASHQRTCDFFAMVPVDVDSRMQRSIETRFIPIRSLVLFRLRSFDDDEGGFLFFSIFLLLKLILLELVDFFFFFTEIVRLQDRRLSSLFAACVKQEREAGEVVGCWLRVIDK